MVNVRDMPFTVTNSQKRGLKMHTYGRQSRRILNDEVSPAFKRRRLASSVEPESRLIVVDADDDVDATTNLKRAIRESEALVLASAIKANPDYVRTRYARIADLEKVAAPADVSSASNTGVSISEATANEESVEGNEDVDDLSTPPSSPPALRLSFPDLKSRKPAFAFLKRRRENKRSRGASRLHSKASTQSAESNANSTNTPPSRKGSRSERGTSTRKPKVLRQTQLDLGSDANATQHCKGCGMDYVSANAEDVALHKKFHNVKLSADGVDLGRAFIKANASRWIYEAARFEEGYVVIVDRKSSAAAKHQAMKVLEVVHQELGSAEIDEATLWSQVEMPARLKDRATDAGSEQANELLLASQMERADRYKVFLHMKDSKCVGLCLTERIWESNLIEKPKSPPQRDTSDPTKPVNMSSSITASTTVEPAIVGISRIWTSASSRRKGIAMDLLDCVRSNYIYGMEIPKEQIAFSQPTESGCRLIGAFYGDDTDWHVYQEK
ncbi:N-acetyltransferase O1 (Establishment of cohesion protein 1) [Ascosphaera pollenicola]|nr:N-acetyltransferase O1 (Establishment of cohesion protein 1) [Ascosphaera pollenicola]